MTPEQFEAYKRQRLEQVLQRPNPNTLAAIRAAKSDDVTDASPDDL
jgi:hypothetical protein